MNSRHMCHPQRTLTFTEVVGKTNVLVQSPLWDAVFWLSILLVAWLLFVFLIFSHGGRDSLSGLSTQIKEDLIMVDISRQADRPASEGQQRQWTLENG